MINFNLNHLPRRILYKIFRLKFYKYSFSGCPVFIHIPKTAGTFLGQLENLNKPLIYPVDFRGHVSLINSSDLLYNHNFPKKCAYPRKFINRNIVKNRIVFTIIRNPFSWLASYWSHAGGLNKRYSTNVHYDHQIANKGFDYFVKSVFNRNIGWPSIKFPYLQIFDNNGNLVIDHFIYQEFLIDDAINFAKQNNLSFNSYIANQKLRKGNYGKDYRSLYNSNLIDLVNKNWSNVIELFGYDFDGIVKYKADARKEYLKVNKSKIKYDIETDSIKNI